MSIDFERELGKFTNDLDPAKAAQARALVHGSEAWRLLYGEVDLSASPVSVEFPRVETVASTAQSPVAKIETSTPPDILLRAQERLTREGLRFDLMPYPRKRLVRNSRFWRGKVAPEPWFWDQINQGKIDRSAASLYGNWALIEAVQKPAYKGGRQMYYDGNDPLSSYLEELRRNGEIEITDWTRNVPQNSRFGLSVQEIDRLVVPHVQGILGTQVQVGLPREIEFNVAGNLKHPEWGQTNTWELLADKFEGSVQLVGGSSDYGGLASVSADGSGSRRDGVGFRLQVVPSPKA